MSMLGTLNSIASIPGPAILTWYTLTRAMHDFKVKRTNAQTFKHYGLLFLPFVLEFNAYTRYITESFSFLFTVSFVFYFFKAVSRRLLVTF